MNIHRNQSLAFGALLLSAAVLFSFLSHASGATAVATYIFSDNLNALEGGAPALVATDPLGANAFENDVVLGQPRRVYHYDGNSFPTNQQAGLTLDTTGLFPAADYSAELVFEFLEGANRWRRIIDVQNRLSDNGFYVDPANTLAVFPVAGSPEAFTNNVYHHVVLTDSGGTVKAYLDGTLQFTLATNVMDINNAGDLLHLFLDNTLGNGQSEFSDGKIALARFYSGALSDAEVGVLVQDPFANVPPIPEPVAGFFLLAGGMLLAGHRARKA